MSAKKSLTIEELKRLFIAFQDAISESHNIYEKVRSFNDLLSDPEKFPSRYGFKEDIYPVINYTLDYEEVLGLINKDYSFHDDFQEEIGDNPAAKVLYAALWKLGELPKLPNILRGLAKGQPKSKNLVLYQFGKHLADKSNPIIDQHCIRAYRLHLKDFGRIQDECIEIRKKYGKQITIEEINAYRDWLDKIFASDYKCLNIADKILFMLGKASKLN